MSIPFGGNWQGLRADQMSEVMAFCMNAINERRQAINASLETWIDGKQFVTASDLAGLDIHGSVVRQLRLNIFYRLGALTERTFNNNSVSVYPVKQNGEKLLLSDMTNIELSSFSDPGFMPPLNRTPRDQFFNEYYWLWVKDVIAGLYMWKIFMSASPSNYTINWVGEGGAPYPSYISQNGDALWQSISTSNDYKDPFPSTRDKYLEWYVRLNTSTGRLEGGAFSESNRIYASTENLSGVVTGGRVHYNMLSANSIIHETGNLIEDFDVNIGGQTINTSVNGRGHVEYSGWTLGSPTTLVVAGPDWQTYNNSPFNGSSFGATGLGGVTLRRGEWFETGGGVVFDSEVDHLILDTSSVLTDKV